MAVFKLLRVDAADKLRTVIMVVLAISSGSVDGGWVVERDDRGASPLLKDRKAIALTPQQEQKQLAHAYRGALKAEQEKIRSKWNNPEVSSQTRWVSYTENYAVKSVVDFEYNRIEVSLSGIYKGNRLDFTVMSGKVRAEVETVLGTTVKDAIQQDPIQKAVDAAYASLGAPSNPANASSELVLKEMFPSSAPSASVIGKQAQKLMRNATIRYQALNASFDSLPIDHGKKLTYVIPLPDNRIRKKVVEYKPYVHKNCKRFALSEDVVMSIIHTESHFNPLARSHIPAFGLMQIVPSTSGRDATRKLYKKSKLLTAQYLYDPKKNIEVGAAYLNVLYYQYLKSIKDPESRLYYTIAAYNAGASRVARAFIDKPSFKQAVDTINTMTPQQVLQRLVDRAPSQEARDYIKKVLKRRNYYATL